MCEVRYEDLVRDPVGRLRAIYDQLQLADFERVRPALEKVVAASKDYRTNRFELAPEIIRQIESRWGNYLRQFGYETTDANPS